MKENAKCFIKIGKGHFEEITYKELKNRRNTIKTYKDKKFIYLHGMLMEVSPEEYVDYYYEGNISEIDDNNKTIKVSRDYQRLYKKILEARTLLTQKLMKEPTNYEISLFLEIDENIINEVMRYQEKVKSLDEVIIDDGKEVTLLDQISTHNINEEYVSLYDCLNTLTDTEKSFIDLRYFQGRTQSEIAQILGVNQVKVSRNEQKILKKIKNNLREAL